MSSLIFSSARGAALKSIRSLEFSKDQGSHLFIPSHPENPAISQYVHGGAFNFERFEIFQGSHLFISSRTVSTFGFHTKYIIEQQS